MEPRPLLLGFEWFPDVPGGLARGFVDLWRGLATDGRRPPAVVVGPVSDPPPEVAVVDRSWLPLRLLRYGQAARRLRASADLVDTHFALYGIAALLAGAARGRPMVVHFHGPWAQESIAEDEARMKVVAKRGGRARRLPPSHGRGDPQWRLQAGVGRALRRPALEGRGGLPRRSTSNGSPPGTSSGSARGSACLPRARSWSASGGWSPGWASRRC